MASSVDEIDAEEVKNQAAEDVVGKCSISTRLCQLNTCHTVVLPSVLTVGEVR